MTLSSFLIFLPTILSGSLIVHLLWPERRPMALLLKLSLGVGLGMGISSILYFMILVVAPGRVNMLLVTFILFAMLSLAVLVREQGRQWDQPRFPRLSGLQWGLVTAMVVALGFMTLTFFNLILSRPQGAFDAWSIWDRAARFIYRDPQNWHAAFSPELDWLNHPDYPLLVPLNVAWGWEAVGQETQRIPIIQAMFFVLASAALMFASVGLVRTIGQASLSTLVLICTPTFIAVGAGLVSDIPVMYYILASSVLIFLALTQQPRLWILSGFMAGLAGWAKNEGLLFIVVSMLVLILTRPKGPGRVLTRYSAGLAVPFAVLLYFKSIAPANDIFALDAGNQWTRIVDLSRYWLLLKAIGAQALGFGGWSFSILFALAIYALVVRLKPSSHSRLGVLTIAAIIMLQFLGYCAVYVLTPHDLEWHLGTSLGRLILHIFPSALFLYFNTIKDPETIFA